MLQELQNIYQLYYDAIQDGNEEQFFFFHSDAWIKETADAHEKAGLQFPGSIDWKALAGLVSDPTYFKKTSTVFNTSIALLINVAPSYAIEGIQGDESLIQVIEFRREGKNSGWKIVNKTIRLYSNDSQIFADYNNLELMGFLKKYFQEIRPSKELATEAPANPFPESIGLYPIAHYGKTPLEKSITFYSILGQMSIPARLLTEKSQTQLWGSIREKPAEFTGYVFGEKEKIDAAHALDEESRLKLNDYFGSAKIQKQKPSVKSVEGYPVDLASYLGDEQSGKISDVFIREDGMILLACEGGNAHLKIPAISHDKFSGYGSVVFFDPSIGMPVYQIHLPDPPRQIEQDAEKNLYVATGGSISKFDRDGLKRYYQSTASVKKMTVSADGHVFALSGLKVTHYDAEGKETLSWNVPNEGTGTHTKRSNDIIFDDKNKQVIVSGNNSGNSKKSGIPVFVPWIVAYPFNTSQPSIPEKENWWMYNHTHTEVDPNGMADSRCNNMTIGPDGMLYFLGDSEGGNSPFNFDPKEMDKKFANNPFEGNLFSEMWRANSARKVTFIAKADPKKGNILKASYLYGMRDDERRGQPMIGYLLGKDIAVDTNGNIVVTGVSNSQIKWTENAVHKRHMPEISANNYGHPIAPDEFFVTIFNPDLSQLVFNSGFAQSIDDLKRFRSRGEVVAARNGIIVAAGWSQKEVPEEHKDEENYDASPFMFRKNALQPKLQGNFNGYFVVMGTASKMTFKERLAAQFDFLPLKKSQNFVQMLARAKSFKKGMDDIKMLSEIGRKEDPDLDFEIKFVEQRLKDAGFYFLELAKQTMISDPLGAKKFLSDIKLYWKGTEVETAAIDFEKSTAAKKPKGA